MELSTLRKMVVVSIALLLIYQVGTWIAVIFGAAWAGASALLVAAVSFVCARLAKSEAGNTAWFLVPTLLFTVLPLAANIWTALTDTQSSWLDKVIGLTPFLVGFVIPVALLLLVYNELRKRTIGS